MSKWINVSEVNNILGKALESCKDELNPSFYGGARLMLDKINEMAEEVADTPQTEKDKVVCPNCGRSDYIRSFEKDFGIKNNGDKSEWYLDAYKKFENQVIPEQTDCPWK